MQCGCCNAKLSLFHLAGVAVTFGSIMVIMAFVVRTLCASLRLHQLARTDAASVPHELAESLYSAAEAAHKLHRVLYYQHTQQDGRIFEQLYSELDGASRGKLG